VTRDRTGGAVWRGWIHVALAALAASDAPVDVDDFLALYDAVHVTAKGVVRL
jgi:hypothetical protein